MSAAARNCDSRISKPQSWRTKVLSTAERAVVERPRKGRPKSRPGIDYGAPQSAAHRARCCRRTVCGRHFPATTTGIGQRPASPTNSLLAWCDAGLRRAGRTCHGRHGGKATAIAIRLCFLHGVRGCRARATRLDTGQAASGWLERAGAGSCALPSFFFPCGMPPYVAPNLSCRVAPILSSAGLHLLVDCYRRIAAISASLCSEPNAK
jgi:hypothetical protein